MKIGPPVDSGQMYHVYHNQAAAAHSSLYFYIFLSLQFSALRSFVTLFSGTARPRRLKLDTHIDTGQMLSCVLESGCCCLFIPLFLHVSFSPNFQTLKVFITLFSGTVRPRGLKLGTHVDSGQMYHVYQNQTTAAYLALYFFVFLSLQLSNIKKFRHIFLRNCEV